MKKLSLQWRITLMTVLLIGATCVAMNLLLSYSGRRYMDSIGSYMTNYGETDKGEPDFFDPEREKLDQELTIVIHGAQDSFATTGWYITVAVTVLSGVLAYFFSGHALKPLRTFASQVEQVQPNNLPDMKITEDVLPEFRQFSKPFNRMLERLDGPAAVHRKRRPRIAHAAGADAGAVGFVFRRASRPSSGNGRFSPASPGADRADDANDQNPAGDERASHGSLHRPH